MPVLEKTESLNISISSLKKLQRKKKTGKEQNNPKAIRRKERISTEIKQKNNKENQYNHKVVL